MFVVFWSHICTYTNQRPPEANSWWVYNSGLWARGVMYGGGCECVGECLGREGLSVGLQLGGDEWGWGVDAVCGCCRGGRERLQRNDRVGCVWVREVFRWGTPCFWRVPVREGVRLGVEPAGSVHLWRGCLAQSAPVTPRERCKRRLVVEFGFPR